MRRPNMKPGQLFLGVALSLAALAPAAAAANIHSIGFGDTGALGVVGGDVRVVSSEPEFYDWELNVITETPRTIRVLRPENWSGWYLAYDPEGKDNGVFLARKSGPGTQWVLTKVRGKGEGLHVYAIQPASGKSKGWYLDIAAEGEKLKDKEGKPFTAYPVFLAEQPKHLPKGATILEIAP
jgi:hypothetical protein